MIVLKNDCNFLVLILCRGISVFSFNFGPKGDPVRRGCLACPPLCWRPYSRPPSRVLDLVTLWYLMTQQLWRIELNISQFKIYKGFAVLWKWLQLPTAAAQVRPQVRSCGICGEKTVLRQAFSEYFGSLPIFIPPSAPYSLIILS
jgi:hypothetical protein